MTKEKLAAIGKTAIIKSGKEGLVVEVTVLDYKTSYGHDRYLVTPVAGSGEVWVETIVVKE